MFADPFSNLMLIVLLFFAGLLVMFIFMMRSIDHNWRNQEETRRQMSLSLSDLERKVNELGMLLRNGSATMHAAEERECGEAGKNLPELSLFTADTPGGEQPADKPDRTEPSAPPPDLLIGIADSDENFEILPHGVEAQLADSEADLALFHESAASDEENTGVFADKPRNS